MVVVAGPRCFPFCLSSVSVMIALGAVAVSALRLVNTVVVVIVD